MHICPPCQTMSVTNTSKVWLLIILYRPTYKMEWGSQRGWKSTNDNYVPQESSMKNCHSNPPTTPHPPFFGRKNPRDSQNDTWLDIRVGVLTCAPALSTFVPSHGNFSFPGNTDPHRSLRRVSLKVEIFRLWGRGVPHCATGWQNLKLRHNLQFCHNLWICLLK